LFLALEILAIVILILVVLFAAVLLVPFNLTVNASKTETSMTGTVVVRWLGIRVWRKSIPGGEKKRQKPKEGPKRLDLLTRVPRLISLVSDAIPSLVGILKGFVRAVHFRRLSIDVSFGVGDPADTALLAGYAWSVVWAFNFVPRTSLSLYPDVERARLDGSVSAELGVRLLPIVTAFLMAYTKKPFRQLIKEVRR
jgi:hypothetical protein